MALCVLRGKIFQTDTLPCRVGGRQSIEKRIPTIERAALMPVRPLIWAANLDTMRTLSALFLLAAAPLSAFSCAVTVISYTDASCFNNCDGSATTAAAGFGPLQYSWSPGGQTTAIATGLCRGTYTVTLTDAIGCTSQAVVSIGSPPDILFGLELTHPTCYGYSNGMAKVVPAGGTGNYTRRAWLPP